MSKKTEGNRERKNETICPRLSVPLVLVIQQMIPSPPPTLLSTTLAHTHKHTHLHKRADSSRSLVYVPPTYTAAIPRARHVHSQNLTLKHAMRMRMQILDTWHGIQVRRQRRFGTNECILYRLVLSCIERTCMRISPKCSLKRLFDGSCRPSLSTPKFQPMRRQALDSKPRIQASLVDLTTDSTYIRRYVRDIPRACRASISWRRSDPCTRTRSRVCPGHQGPGHMSCGSQDWGPGRGT